MFWIFPSSRNSVKWRFVGLCRGFPTKKEPFGGGSRFIQSECLKCLMWKNFFSNCSPVRLEIFWQFFEKPEEKKMQIQDVSLEFLQALDVAGNAKERRNTSLGASFFLEKTEARGDFKIESDIANCYGLLYLWDVSFFSSRMGEASNSKVQQDLIHIIWIWFDWYEIDIKVEVISSGIGWCYQIYLQKIHLELFCAKSTLGRFFTCVFFPAENESQVLALAWVHTWSTKTRQSRDDFWGKKLRWSHW